MYLSTTAQQRRMLWLILIMQVVGIQSDINGGCTFPDRQYIVPQNDNVEYPFDNSCKWRCIGLSTGRGCTDICNMNTEESFCDAGTRRLPCRPPLNQKCVACAQHGDEARQGGYSFDTGSSENPKYDLLLAMGSFENSKIYPDAGMKTRPAVNTNLSIGDVVPWSDVLFPGNGFVEFLGIGKMDLHYGVGQGASYSDTFAVLTAPSAKLRICAIQTRDERRPGNNPSGNYHYINGLVYEFQYRQRLPSTDVIVAKAELLPEGGGSAMLDDSFILPSTDKWTRSQRLFDYTDLYGLTQLTKATEVDYVDPPEYACFQIEFKVEGYIALQIDELRIFANLIRNSQFSSVGSWTLTPSIPPIDDPWDEWVHNGYVVLNGTRRIQQSLTLSEYDNPSSVVAATFSMEVRGNGILVVIYTLDAQAASAGYAEVKEHEKYLVVKTISDDGVQDASEWQLLEIPLTLHVGHPNKDVHTIMILNKADDINEALHIDNVFMYADDRRCPVLSCDEPDKRVFVNGRCELCTLQTGEICPAGTKQSGCEMQVTRMVPICNACPVVNVYDISSGTVTAAGGAFVESSTEECTFICSPGWWYVRGGVNTTGPVCKQCTPISELRCRVGWYAVACTDETDTTCLPCDTLDQYDESVVYTTANYNISTYHASKSMQCKNSCTSGQFQYGVRATSGVSMCFACTMSICGAKENGLSTFRVIDGLQYTSRCTESKDSQCQLCESDDAAVLFTGNGDGVGDWCQYECIAGSMPCGTCTWDPSNAEVYRNATHYSTYGVGTETVIPTGNIPFNQSLMVRFTGSATISTARFGAQVAIMVYAITQSPASTWYPPNETGRVLQLFPLVPPTAIATMRQGKNFTVIDNAPIQQFDTTIEMRDFVNTNSFQQWNNLNVWNGVTVFLKYEIVTHIDGSDVMSDGNPTTSGGINVSDFVVQIQYSVGGCCAPRDLNNIQPVDHRVLSRCVPCDHAMGISSNHTNPLPANAHWNTPNNCGWACNKQYELLQGGDGRTCEYCGEQTCNIGQYSDICDSCLDCEPPVANANFTGAGNVRYDNTSCPVKCDKGFYYDTVDRLCVHCTPSTVLNCSTKPGGYFFELQCGDVDDAVCVNCRVCALGYNASIACGEYHDSTCTACDKSKLIIPNTGGVQWRLGNTSNDYCAWGCIDGTTYNAADNTCVACHGTPCGIGYYRVPCTQDNGFTGCAPCIIPANAVVLSPGLEFQDDSCIWECPESMDYNATTSLCVPRPVVIATTITIRTPAGPCEDVVSTVDGVVSHICGWGSFMDLSRLIELGTQPQNGFEPTACQAICTMCPVLLDTMVYTQQGSCKSVCIRPLMWDGRLCVPVTPDAE
jgi:hypothetical protein